MEGRRLNEGRTSSRSSIKRNINEGFSPKVKSCPGTFGGNNIAQNYTPKWKDKFRSKSIVQSWQTSCERISAIVCRVMNIPRRLIGLENRMHCQIGRIVKLYLCPLKGFNIHEKDSFGLAAVADITKPQKRRDLITLRKTVCNSRTRACGRGDLQNVHKGSDQILIPEFWETIMSPNQC